jgi:hypothetical protein
MFTIIVNIIIIIIVSMKHMDDDFVPVVGARHTFPPVQRFDFPTAEWRPPVRAGVVQHGRPPLRVSEQHELLAEHLRLQGLVRFQVLREGSGIPEVLFWREKMQSHDEHDH